MERTGPVLIEEELDRYQPLGAFGQPVYQSHLQLQAALRQRLGDRYANFFAVPQVDAQGKRVSWIAPVEGEVRRWSELEPDEQASRALDLQVMKSEFDTYLNELRAYENEGKEPRGARAFVAVMEQALRTPNDGHLHFVGDQPVSTFWGFREEENAPFETLSAAPRAAVAAVAPAATVAAAPEQPRRSLAWLWWLLPLLLLLLLLLLWWFWPDETPAIDENNLGGGIEEPVAVDEGEPDLPLVEDPEQPEYFDRDGVIVDRDGVVVPGALLDEDGNIVDEEGNILVPEAEVIPEEEAIVPEGEGVGEEGLGEDGAPVPEEPLTEEPPAEEPPAEEPGAEEPGAEEGEQPPAPEPETPETPEEPQAEDPNAEQPQDPANEEGAEAPGAPPAIPEDAADGVADFMQGNWRSDSGLVDSQTRQKLTQDYNFDENGQGEVVIRRADGVTCRAPAEATVKDGNLQVEEQRNLTCSDGSSFKRSRTVCKKGPSGQAECIGTDADGNRFKVDLNRNAQP